MRESSLETKLVESTSTVSVPTLLPRAVFQSISGSNVKYQSERIGGA